MTELPEVPRMKPPEGGAVVRMYCTGLGDCFLLGFPAEGRTCYVLIDCGAWRGTPDVKPWMEQIMEHIKNEVGDAGIDLLVATHPHWDHLSGFRQARDIFREIKVKQVWLPWTENPDDRVALRLAEERRAAFNAAIAAVTKLGKQLGADGVTGLKAVLQLADENQPSDLLGVGTDDLMKLVREKVDKPIYVRPSLKPLALGGAPGVRIYALGPPTNPKLLGRDNPSTAPGKSEVYLAQSDLQNEHTALYAAAYRPESETEDDHQKREQETEADRRQREQKAEADRRQRDLACPFDRWLHQGSNSEHSLYFHYRYWEGPAWRQIDTDWLETVSQLALDLDDHVNNTSLVLAFELGENGPVLLFPGDAQVGNWLSWHELESVNGITAESLLNRTVLYKVGHHGSHNATLKDKGLKMMTDTTRLVAMIPVDQEEARKPKGRNKDGWAMPYGKLLADLELRTEGRVIRADLGLQKPSCDLDEKQKERWEQFDRTLAPNIVRRKGRILFIQHTVRPGRPRGRGRGRTGV